MQLRRFHRQAILAVALVGLSWSAPASAHAQISKVDGRAAECAPSFFSIEYLRAFCKKPICPTCKTRYCPLDAMPNYGYSSPRWHPFPGTTPAYTPKKKDIGISSPPPAPPPEAGATRLPATPAEPMVRPTAPTQAVRVPEFPSFPIAPGSKASVGPDIKPIDIDDPH